MTSSPIATCVKRNVWFQGNGASERRMSACSPQAVAPPVRQRGGSIVPCGVGVYTSRPTRLRRGPRCMSDRSTWIVAGQEVAHGKATFGAPMVFARLGRIAPVSLDRAEERIRTAIVHAASDRSRVNKPEDTSDWRHMRMLRESCKM